MSNPRHGRPSLCSRLRQQEGTTVSELVATLAIITIVAGGLTTIFVSAVHAESRQRTRLDAQQNARLGLVRMREELHCASGISAAGGAVATLTAAVPAVCFGTTGASVAVTYRTATVATGRYQLERVQNGTATVLADYLTSATPFAYTSPTTTTLGSLRVDLRVDVDPSSGAPIWNLVDDIALRNTTRA